MNPIHGTCVAHHGQGVLLIGKSGAGKSDLALRLINHGFVLVADDQIILSYEDALLLASAPPNIAGKIEVRGIGIIEKNYLNSAPLGLVVELAEREAVERLPEPLFFSHNGLDIPLIKLHAFDGSTILKIEIALGQIGLKNRTNRKNK